MTVRPEVFRNALAILDQEGWCQGTTGLNGSKTCVGGAIAEAVTGERANLYVADEDGYEELKEALETFLGHVSEPTFLAPDGVYIWNDNDERTEEDVKAALQSLAGVSTVGSASV